MNWTNLERKSAIFRAILGNILNITITTTKNHCINEKNLETFHGKYVCVLLWLGPSCANHAFN